MVNIVGVVALMVICVSPLIIMEIDLMLMTHRNRLRDIYRNWWNTPEVKELEDICFKNEDCMIVHEKLIEFLDKKKERRYA